MKDIWPEYAQEKLHLKRILPTEIKLRSSEQN